MPAPTAPTYSQVTRTGRARNRSRPLPSMMRAVSPTLDFVSCFALVPVDRFAGQDGLFDTVRAADLSRAFQDGKDLRDRRRMPKKPSAGSETEDRGLNERPFFEWRGQRATVTPSSRSPRGTKATSDAKLNRSTAPPCCVDARRKRLRPRRKRLGQRRAEVNCLGEGPTRVDRRSVGGFRNRLPSVTRSREPGLLRLRPPASGSACPVSDTGRTAASLSTLQV